MISVFCLGFGVYNGKVRPDSQAPPFATPLTEVLDPPSKQGNIGVNECLVLVSPDRPQYSIVDPDTLSQ